MMKKFIFLALGSLLFALCVSAQAQQPKRVPRIGFLAGNREGTSVGEFQRGLKDLGYVDGKNILTEYRYTEGKADSTQSLVTELVQLKVNILVVTSLAGIRAAKQATKTIPIVMGQLKIQSRLG